MASLLINYVSIFYAIFMSLKFRLLQKHQSGFSSPYTITIRLYLSCDNEVDNFKAFIYNLYLFCSCCILCIIVVPFFSTHCCRFPLRISLPLIFLYFVAYIWQSRTPEIETADLSQSHIDLNLSQYQGDCLFYITSNTATKNILINTLRHNNIDK